MIIKTTKRIIALLLSTLFLSLAFFSLTVFAADYGKKYTYTDIDGTSIEYYLDENGYPFQIKYGEKISLLLPLEHLKITNENELKELRDAHNAAKQKFETYVNSTKKSNWTSFHMNFANYNIANTGDFGFPPICHTIWLKTTNHNTTLL